MVFYLPLVREVMDMATIRARVKRQKLNTRGGKGKSTNLTQHSTKVTTNISHAPNTARQPVMKPQEKENDTIQRNKERYDAKKRKA